MCAHNQHELHINLLFETWLVCNYALNGYLKTAIDCEFGVTHA